MSVTQIHGKVFAIEMPVDLYGHGPVTDGTHLWVWYEVWDQVAQIICRCANKEDAQMIARLINWDQGEVGN